MIMRLFALLVVFVCCSTSYAEEVVEIPLADMWGQGIKGTMSPGKLFPTKPVLQLANDTNDKLAHWAIRKWVEQQPNESIHKCLYQRKEMRPGFVVGSVDAAALLTAKMVLCDGLEPNDTFSTQHPLTLVFFTRGIEVFDLKSVKREGHRIEVEYQAPKQLIHTAPMPRFALMPLGKLPAGKYEVVIPDNNHVCRSFQFQVKEH